MRNVGRAGLHGNLVTAAALALGCASIAPAAALAQDQAAQQLPAGPAARLTYADLAGLVEAADIIAVVEVRRQTNVDATRAPGLAPGHARLYLEAQTQALIAAPAALGQALTFLADVPLGDNGRAPRVRRQRFVIFADPVAGRPGQLQLVQPDAMIPADPAFEARLRSVVGQFAAGEVPPRITGIRDVLYTPGNLAGESETQMFVQTETGLPASLSVVRRPGMEPAWGVSWSEIIDQSATAPARDTPEWYRLACGLPRELPEEAFLQEPGPDRQRARADYQVILDTLGPCARSRP